ncbi:hypothetical protein BDY17DRAFT_79917 [Neohortaea acidophila]|uniref:FAD-binding PCMH-type domain-containing protein n=1 Tax=Neohortaea acidophila TaxID=245834 RepID=A0A6A6Q500_9PEZI|nr:uncharacterized protein BDY17DRAFT_79917 [Neohortaea acidophila]KAF2486487.1 hypothetical protein BDY17DRAFT_79917 [Neohortaea acidophila]
MSSKAPSKRLITPDDINKLRDLLSSTDAHVRAPSDADYDKSISRWSSAAQKPAGVAIVPTTAQEVSIAVKYASENGIDLAVKCGGHSTAGVSSTNGGLLIDLGRMRGVDVDAEKRLLHVQGGALWMDVDAAAWKHGLATVGGTVADTGVGGLTLGGGYGHLSGGLGLVIDNTVSFTVVLANGEIKTASKHENEDLFWALNGAGQNFGVVTEFVLQAYPQKELYMGMLLFPPTPEVITKLVAIINDLFTIHQTPEGPQAKVKGQLGSLIGFAKPPPAGGETMILMTLVFNGTEEEAKPLLQPLFDLNPAVNAMRMDAYPEANKLIPQEYGLRSSMKGAAFMLPVREQFFNDCKETFEKFIDSCDDAAGSVVAWELFDPSKVAELSTGSFANRGHHLNSLVMPVWKQAENDKRCRQFARDVSNMFKEEIELQGKQASEGLEGGAGVRGKQGAVMLYGNYDQYEEISKDIFGSNYPELQKLKAKYDPTNMFDKLFAITPDKARA